MQVPFFQIDAFTSTRFKGNPAAVMVLPTFPSDTLLQTIAAENNLAETAFLVPRETDYSLRWFTPAVEVPLCGHATLASAAVVIERLDIGRDTVTFSTASGLLKVWRKGGSYTLDFPTRQSEAIPIPADMASALNATPIEVYSSQYNYLVLLDSAKVLRELKPDFAAIAGFDRPGLIVTAKGDEGFDFVSRYFAPAKGVSEDPVTGAAHCMLAPYWAAKTGKTAFRAHQASRRGGEVRCRLSGDRVELEGNCIFFIEGHASIDF
ncbi:PhzF family phenazine biosynthesis protein [Shinella sp.]|jgi:PhzF family phenazine biosynthesis protein|uniref:PhzF family phenazine biosynthesis protein n=1 Tax=Shinella sp. TaxID=1870904 RepID=UPI003F6F555C